MNQFQIMLKMVSKNIYYVLIVVMALTSCQKDKLLIDNHYNISVSTDKEDLPSGTFMSDKIFPYGFRTLYRYTTNEEFKRIKSSTIEIEYEVHIRSTDTVEDPTIKYHLIGLKRMEDRSYKCFVISWVNPTSICGHGYRFINERTRYIESNLPSEEIKRMFPYDVEVRPRKYKGVKISPEFDPEKKNYSKTITIEEE